MKSPVNGKGAVSLEKKIKVADIVQAYQEVYHIDVKKYFKDLEFIEVHRCEDTGYRFYFPFFFSGDSDFYIHFQKFDWYYMPWKWEHELSMQFIRPDDRILEVGSGSGSFIKRISKEKGNPCVGLELNESSVYKDDKLEVINTTVEAYSALHPESFDIVCSYQVLEHISSVQSFLQAKIACLKKGGKLIICVPNNNSFVKYSDNVLNTPPHHMGLWDEKSLKALENFFPVKLSKMLFEPLQPYHASNHIESELRSRIGKLPTRILMKTMRTVGYQKKVEKSLLKRADSIIGHSVMAVYEKI